MTTTVIDTNIVDLHRLTSGEAIEVAQVTGDAWRVVLPAGLADAEEEAPDPVRVVPGMSLAIGETLALGPGAVVVAGGSTYSGGRRGRAHSFVAEEENRSSPSRKDVPKLLRELAQVERTVVERLGEDPLESQRGPESPFERAMSREFALQNLTLEAARSLPEQPARNSRSVCLFFHDETACVATVGISVAKIRLLMEAIGRPISPHLVDEDTMRILLEMVYGGPSLS